MYIAAFGGGIFMAEYSEQRGWGTVLPGAAWEGWEDFQDYQVQDDDG